MRQVGAEGIVSKRRSSFYRGGESREWLKTKVFEVGIFTVTGFIELGDRRLDTITVAEERGSQLRPAGAVKFGLAGRGLWHILDQLRVGVARKSFVPVRPVLQAQVKLFGRYQRGWIRDGVLLTMAYSDTFRGHGKSLDAEIDSKA